MNEKALLLYVKAQNQLSTAKEKVKDFLQDEEGDTNFLSILILLGIGLALAAVFINFKDQILDWFNQESGLFFNGGNEHTSMPGG